MVHEVGQSDTTEQTHMPMLVNAHTRAAGDLEQKNLVLLVLQQEVGAASHQEPHEDKVENSLDIEDVGQPPNERHSLRGHSRLYSMGQ